MKLSKILNWMFPSKLRPIPRTDPVLRGFYGSDALQPREVTAFTEIHWESMFNGEGQGFENIRTAAKPAVVDVGYYLFDGVGTNHVLAPDAENRLRAFRTRLEAAGLMRYAWAIYPIDEPNLTVSTEADVAEANAIVRRVFPNAKLAVIYSGIEKLWRIEDYDLVGFDDYGPGAEIFEVTLFPWPPKSDYDRLAEKLRPDQLIILVPGGGDPWQQDPAPFYKKAAEDGRVAIVLAFLWIDRPENGYIMQGIRSNGMAKAYG